MIGTAVQQVGLSNNVMLQVAEVIRDRFAGVWSSDPDRKTAPDYRSFIRPFRSKRLHRRDVISNIRLQIEIVTSNCFERPRHH